MHAHVGWPHQVFLGWWAKKLERQRVFTNEEVEFLVREISYERCGTANVLVQSCFLAWGESPENRMRVHCRPCILERKTASNVSQALDSSIPTLAFDRIFGLSPHVRIIFLLACTDAAPTMLRIYRELEERMPGNVLIFHNTCDIHRVSRIQQVQLQARDIMSFLHSSSLLLRLHNHHFKWISSIIELVSKELVWHRNALPDPTWRRFSSIVLDYSVGRNRSLRAASHPNAVLPAPPPRGSQGDICKVLGDALGGNWLADLATHYCTGVCDPPCQSKAQAVAKVLKPLIDVYKLLQCVACLSRWVGPAMSESLWLFAFACHGIGCRAWLAAWPTEHYHVMEAWNDMDISEADRWHRENSQRIAKVSRTLADRDVLLDMFLHSITDQPLDALIQFVSASGSPMTSTRPAIRPIIFDMIRTSGSPAENTQRSLARLLDDDSPLLVVLRACFARYFDMGEDEYWRVWGGLAFQFLLWNACGLYSRVEWKYLNFPCQIFNIANPELSLEDRRRHAQQFLGKRDCCLDSQFGRRLRKVASVVDELMAEDIQEALRVGASMADTATADLERDNAQNKVIARGNGKQPLGVARFCCQSHLQSAAKDHQRRGGEHGQIGIRASEINQCSDVSTFGALKSGRKKALQCAKWFYLNRQSHKWRVETEESGGPMTRDDYLKARERWSLAYDESPEIQAQAKRDWEANRLEPEDGEAGDASAPQFQPSPLGMDTREYVLEPGLFGKWLEDNRFGSFTAAANHVLESGFGDLMISDPQVGEAEPIDNQPPCCESTPGICPTQDSDVFNIVGHSWRSLGKVVAHLHAKTKGSKSKPGLPLVGTYFKFGLVRGGRELGAVYAVVGRCIFLPVNQLFVVCDQVGDRVSLRMRSQENPAWVIKFAPEMLKALIHDTLGSRPFALEGLVVSMTQLDARLIRGGSLADRRLVGTGETWELFPKAAPVPPTQKVPRDFQAEDPGEETLWRMLESLQSVRQRKDIMERIARLRRAEHRQLQGQKPVGKKPTNSKVSPKAGGAHEVGDLHDRDALFVDDPRPIEVDWEYGHTDGAWPDVDAFIAELMADSAGIAPDVVASMSTGSKDASPIHAAVAHASGSGAASSGDPASVHDPRNLDLAVDLDLAPDTGGGGSSGDPVVADVPIAPPPAPVDPPPAPPPPVAPPVIPPPPPPVAPPVPPPHRWVENFFWKSHCKFSFKDRVNKRLTMDAFEVECPFHSQPGAATQCTRTESFLRDRPDHREATVRRLKAWVVAGRDIVPWGSDGRIGHKAVPVPSMDAVPSMEELDRWEMPEIPGNLLRKRRLH